MPSIFFVLSVEYVKSHEICICLCLQTWWVQKHKPIIVRGLGRHLEMCARAKWQREEQFAREEKVW